MAPKKIIDKISLDTQVFVSNGFCFNSKSFEALKKLISAGRLSLVMTDITVQEVRARVRKEISDELLRHRQFVNQSSTLHNSSLPEVKTLITKLDDEIVIQDILAQFDGFLQQTNAIIISATSLAGDEVFAKYFAGDPPFGDAQNKKAEFPDAFAIQTLGAWAEDQDSDMFVVSDDKLFQAGCSAFSRLHPHPTLPKVLDEVSSDDAHLSTFLRAQTALHLGEIQKDAAQQFEALGFWVEDEDGEAEVELTDCTLDGDPEILEIDEEDAVLQFNFKCDYTAHLSYNDSATASYDEGDLVYVEHRDESVERQQELEVEVRVSFDRKDLDAVELLDITLTAPSKGFGIETEHNFGWPWK